MNCLGDIVLCTVVAIIIPSIVNASPDAYIEETVCNEIECRVTVVIPLPQPAPELNLQARNTMSENRFWCTGSDGRALHYGYQYQHANGSWSGEIGGDLVGCLSPIIPESQLGHTLRWRIKEIADGQLIHHTKWIEIL